MLIVDPDPNNDGNPVDASVVGRILLTATSSTAKDASITGMKSFLASCAASICIALPCSGGERDRAVNDDRSAIDDSELWIYNDLSKGFDTAKATGKPLLVVYRCIP